MIIILENKVLSEPKSDSKRNNDNTVNFVKLKSKTRSAEKPSRVNVKSPKTTKQPVENKRSPLIPKIKNETGLFSPDSNIYEDKLIRDSDNRMEYSQTSSKQYSPRKALDFAGKSQNYKGRNLFDNNYQ